MYDRCGQPVLLLTDARCLAGSEGGAVLDNCGNVLGMVGPPLQYVSAYDVLVMCV